MPGLVPVGEDRLEDAGIAGFQQRAPAGGDEVLAAPAMLFFGAIQPLRVMRERVERTARSLTSSSFSEASRSLVQILPPLGNT